MLISSLVFVICVINALALIVYRACTAADRSYSHDLFTLPIEGMTITLFGWLPVTVGPRPLWNVLARVLFPLEFAISETSGVVRFTHWFARSESAWSDVVYIVLAAVLLPVKALWNLFVATLIWLLNRYLG